MASGGHRHSRERHAASPMAVDIPFKCTAASLREGDIT